MDPRQQQSGLQADPNFNPDSNPFEGIMSQLQGGSAQGGQGPSAGAGQVSPQPQQPEPQPQMTPEMMKAIGMDPTLDQTQRGSNPGGSKFLLGALQQLQGYIGESDDRDEIAIARSIMQLLTRLIDKDQTKQTEKLDQGQTPPGMPQGQPQGQAPQPGY